ncbi:unnamed protein product [Amoebophrya sp. A120]|nr:unnamed protein product [Amoebophrya sp. A120]|eukprot:GSA120T00009500001.1
MMSSLPLVPPWLSGFFFPPAGGDDGSSALFPFTSSAEPLLRPALLLDPIDPNTLFAFLLLIFLDILGFPSLWDERLFRRVIHHAATGSFFPWRVLNAPILVQLNKGRVADVDPAAAALSSSHSQTASPLSEADIERVLKMCDENGAEEQYFREVQGLNTKSALLSKMAGGQFSSRSTLYYNDFTEKGRKIMLDVGENLREKLGEILDLENVHDNFKLGTSDFRCCLLRYEGKNANFGFHYDTEPWNCFRCLFLIKRGVPKVSPFLYKDGAGELQKVPLSQPGDGLVFQGTRLFHGVAKTNEDDNLRYMLGFQYRFGEDLEVKRKNFCNQFRGKNSVFGSLMEILSKTLPVLVLKEALFPSTLMRHVLEKFDVDMGTNAALSTSLSSSRGRVFGSSLLTVLVLPEDVALEDLLTVVQMPNKLTAICIALLILIAFTKSALVRRIPFVLFCGAGRRRITTTSSTTASASGEEQNEEPILDAALPAFQTQATPRLLSCWIIPLASLFFVCGPDPVLVLLFAAYLCLTEHLLPARFVDILLEDKRKSLEVVRKGRRVM